MRAFSYKNILMAAGLCLFCGSIYAGSEGAGRILPGMPAENLILGEENAVKGETVAPDEIRIEKLADSVLSLLTLRQKIAQLMVIEVSSPDGLVRKTIQNELVRKEKIGGIILMDDELVAGMNRVNELHKMASVPLLVTIDGEWGASMRFKELPAFPRLMQLGALSSDTLVYEMGYAIGKECADLNIHVNFAPDVDINNNPDNPVINTRSFGEDKEKVSEYGVAFMKGMKKAGVAGSAKHFPGHGDTDVDSHKGLPRLPFDRKRLDSLELYPFRRMIEAGTDMVMVGHLSIPALDSSGTPASVSKPIVTGLLRNKLGYDGIITTDALNMDGVCGSLEKKMVPLEAYKAGSDLLLMPVQVKDAITEIEKAVRSGRLSADSLDERCRKILRLKARAGLFDKEYNPLVPLRNLEKRMIKEENLQLMEEISRQSVTVLFNRAAYASAVPVLPVGNPGNKKIAYLGLGVKDRNEMGALLRRYAPVDTVVVRGKIPLDTLRAVRERLRNYDLIILGIHNTDSRPHRNFGIDTVLMRYVTRWAAEQNMAAAYFGSPYALDRIPGYENFRAFIVGYADTPPNNRAAAQIIFGGIPARGVLPVSTAAFKAGESVLLPEKIRLGFRFTSDKVPYSVENGEVRGDYIPRRIMEKNVDGQEDTIRYDTPLPLGEIAPLLTILPRIADMIDRGYFKITDFLGDVIRLPIPKHSKILILDLLTQRSGLPAVGKDFGLDMNTVTNLNLSPARDLVYSNANLYYLYRILEEYGEPDREIKDNARSLLASIGMGDTRLGDGDGFLPLIEATSTADDLSKFITMIHNGGSYGGTVCISPRAASLLEMVLSYYSGGSEGLRIIADPQGKKISYSYGPR